MQDDALPIDRNDWTFLDNITVTYFGILVERVQIYLL